MTSYPPRVLVITAPDPVDIVSLDEAKSQCRVRHSDEDALITRCVAAAISHIDGPGGWLGRAIGLQTLELRLNSFACTDIRLPYPEIVSVESVKYIDGAGTEITMVAEAYELIGQDVSPVWGTSWPSTRGSREAVRIRYDAGYENDVPEAIRAAILLMTADLYRQRETFVTGTIATAVPMSTTVENLLGPHRIFA